VLEPVAILVLVLLAIPLGVGDVERGDSLPRALLQALAWTLGFWLAWAAAIFVAQQAVVPPFVPLWGVSVVALGIGVFRYRRIKE
jgi:lipopolysaccharide export LptBFGC system permease protein LptF